MATIYFEETGVSRWILFDRVSYSRYLFFGSIGAAASYDTINRLLPLQRDDWQGTWQATIKNGSVRSGLLVLIWRFTLYAFAIRDWKTVNR